MSLPTTKVEIAFDSGFSTPEGSRTWTDVSAYVEGDAGVSISYGRADELATPDANSCSLTLDNRDGRFTPAKALLTTGAANPYYPNVKKGRPLRVTVTYNSVDYVRFTGYVNEWPLVWPDSTNAVATVTVMATSRRARMGRAAPLTSAIRAAYLATDPAGYWPMDEEYGAISEFPDDLLFRDVANRIDNPDPARREYITTWWNSAGLQPIINDGTLGPTDETSLVRFPKQSTFESFAHYVGGARATVINTAGEMTAELVARVPGDNGTASTVLLFGVWTDDLNQGLEWALASDGTGQPAETGGGPFLNYFDPVTSTTVGSDIANLYDAATFASASDGEMHHFALTMTGGNVVKAYLDGTLVRTGTLNSPWTYNTRFTSVTVGELTNGTTMWGGHFAVHDRALTAAEILDHADAATAATETLTERITRVAGRVGVLAAEVDVESSIAAALGPQPEAGRAAAEVIDEAASSTGGVAYDTRSGHLAVQARNHRYNAATAFTLSAVAQEVGGDLTATTDDRYLFNKVEYTRAGSDAVPATMTDQDSIDDYGVYSTSLTVVSSSDPEVEAAAQDILSRYADGGAQPRISQVTVDLINLSTAQRALVLAADIGTKFALGSLAAQAPADPMSVFFEGASEAIYADSHTMTISTTPATLYQTTFVWDSATLGKWDSGNVWAY